MKTIQEVFSELEKSKASFKFSSCGGEVFICVDGFMDSLV